MYVSVHFHRGAKHRGRLFHGLSNAMAEVPSRPVVHLQVPLHLERRNTLFGFANDGDSSKPLFKRQMRIVEYRACRGAELVLALFFEALIKALPLVLALCLPDDLGHSHRAALDAAYAVGPAHCLKVV